MYSMTITSRGLLCPEEYLTATVIQIAELTNGCGPKGWLDMVPDTIYGMNIADACNIHDWMYEFGETEMDRQFSDNTFQANIEHLIALRGGNKFIMWLRGIRANTYYKMVRKFGADAFNNKEGT